MRISKTFVVKGDARNILERIEDYFTNVGFKKENATDDLLSLKRGENIWHSLIGYKIQDAKTLLTVHLQPNGGDVMISCEYNIDMSRRNPMSDDKQTILAEIDRLKNILSLERP